MATVTNINEYKSRDLSRFKDGNYDVDSVIKCIIEDGDKAYDLVNKIQEDKINKGVNRIW